MRAAPPVTAVLVALLSMGLGIGPAVAQPAATPSFRAGVDRVTVGAVVRDRKGRLVTTLARQDFELFDDGVRRAITEFESEPAPVSVALLFDVSGSMDIAAKLESGRMAAHHLMSWLAPEEDEAALFAFDTQLRELQPFTTATRHVRSALTETDPFGATSLYDAIAETARRVASRTGRRRAVVALTDGIDTSSRLSASEVSRLASETDVPVYIVVVTSELDHPGVETAGVGSSVVPAGTLADLARWTGGQLFVTTGPSEASSAARQIVTELRHLYLMAFEPSGQPGWHPLTVRARDKALTVHARSGYFAGPGRPSS